MLHSYNCSYIEVFQGGLQGSLPYAAQFVVTISAGILVDTLRYRKVASTIFSL